MIERVFREGRASWSEDILMLFERDLPQEAVSVTFSFSPVTSPLFTFRLSSSYRSRNR